MQKQAKIHIYIYIIVCRIFCAPCTRAYILYFMEVKKMRITIDTERERIIVSDNFFNQIDKMNKVLSENGTDKKIDYVQYIKDAFNKAIENAPIRKSDLKR